MSTTHRFTCVELYGGIEGTIVLTGFFIQIKFCFKGFNSKFKHVKPLKVLYIKPLLPPRRKKPQIETHVSYVVCPGDRKM